MEKKPTIGDITVEQFDSLAVLRDALLECSNPLYNLTHFDKVIPERELGFELGQIYNILLTQHELLDSILKSIDPKRYEYNDF